MVEYILGIDFGHGETSASMKRINGKDADSFRPGSQIDVVHLHLKDGQHVNEYTVKSIVYKNPDGDWKYDPSHGDLANCKEFGSYFKGPVSDHEIKPGTKEYYFAVFIREIIQYIIRAYPNLGKLENPNFLLYVGCPSGWTDSQMENYKNFIQHAVDDSVEVKEIVRESDAAYTYATNCDRSTMDSFRQYKNILTIDYGSSTLDFTYKNATGNVINSSAPLGGGLIEKAIFKYMIGNEEKSQEAWSKVERYCQEDKDIERAKEKIEFLLRIKKEEFYKKWSDFHSFNPRVFLRDIVGNRDGISRNDAFESDRDYDNKALENVILHKEIRALEKALKDFKARSDVGIIDAVVVTGGAARMPFFQKLVKDVFGVVLHETLEVPDNLSLSVSDGITAYGYLNQVGKTYRENVMPEVETDSPQSIIFNALKIFAVDEMKAALLEIVQPIFRYIYEQKDEGSWHLRLLQMDEEERTDPRFLKFVKSIAIKQMRVSSAYANQWEQLSKSISDLRFAFKGTNYDFAKTIYYTLSDYNPHDYFIRAVDSKFIQFLVKQGVLKNDKDLDLNLNIKDIDGFVNEKDGSLNILQAITISFIECHFNEWCNHSRLLFLNDYSMDSQPLEKEKYIVAIQNVIMNNTAEYVPRDDQLIIVASYITKLLKDSHTEIYNPKVSVSTLNKENSTESQDSQNMKNNEIVGTYEGSSDFGSEPQWDPYETDRWDLYP